MTSLPLSSYLLFIPSPYTTPQEDGLVPQPLPDSGNDESTLQEPGAQDDETLERLAQTEQLVVQLKELIREKDSQLANTERQLKVSGQLDCRGLERGRECDC